MDERVAEMMETRLEAQMIALGYDRTAERPAPLRQRLVDMEDGVYGCLEDGEGIACWLSLNPESGETEDVSWHLETAHRNGCAFDGNVALDDLGQSGLVRLLLCPGENEVPLTVHVPVLAAWAEREAGAPGLAQLTMYAPACQLKTAGEDVLQDGNAPGTVRLRGTVTECRQVRNEAAGSWIRCLTVRARGVLVDVAMRENAVCAPALESSPMGMTLEAEGYTTAWLEAGICAAGNSFFRGAGND